MSYRHRHIDARLEQALVRHAAVLVEGVRGVGKTTTAARLATTSLLLDDPRTAALVEADFDVATAGPSPTLIDEWQRVPAVWDAVRRSIDLDRQPGRFILTGSSRSAVSEDIHAGAGRFEIIRLEPMTLSERHGLTPTTRLARLASEGIEAVRGSVSPLSPSEQLEAMFASGLPGLPAGDIADRQQDLRTYLDLAVARDLSAITGVSRNSAKLRAYVRAYGAIVGTTAEHGPIYRAAGVSKVTGETYHDVLTRVGIIDDLPGWSNNRLKRLTKAPKRQLVDPAFATADHYDSPEHLALADQRRGSMFESVAVAQIRAVSRSTNPGWRFSHVRTQGGDLEIDLLIDLPQGGVIAIEVKSSAHVGIADARNLIRLRDNLGDAFMAGLVVHPGEVCSRLDDRIAATPLGLLV